MYQQQKFLSLFGKRLKKFNSIKLKLILPSKNDSEHAPSHRNLLSYIDKNGIEYKSTREKEQEKKSYDIFIKNIYNNEEKEKSDRETFFSRLRGFKDSDEEKQFKEERKRRYQEIINLKKRKEEIESKKLFPNYNEIVSSMRPIINNYEKSEEITKEKYLTDRSNRSQPSIISKKNLVKIINNNNNSYESMSSLPNIDNKNFKSFETNDTNRVPNISLRNNSNNSCNNLLSNKEKKALINLKINKSNISRLLNGKNNSKEMSENFSFINKSNSNNLLLKNNRDLSPIKKNINKKPLNLVLNSEIKNTIKRSISSFVKRKNSNSKDNDNDDNTNRIIKHETTRKLIKYQKKWNLPKTVSFDKIVGRYDKDNKKAKVAELSRVKQYSPNFDSIEHNYKKSLVNYGKSKEIIFKNFKINSTRKLISNLHNLVNKPCNSYSVIDIIKKDKQKRKEEKINKLKEKFGQFYKLANKVK